MASAGSCSTTSTAARPIPTTPPLVNLVRHVAHHFWARIEEINPEQADLNIPADLYSTWRRQIGVRHDGKPRIGVDTIVIAVRSFYYDLHTWAADEPERWAPWVASCPVPPSELRGLGQAPPPDQ
ncbi:hypothetical protein [Streptomyces sp. NPDC056405]|uniref:hypothetical protein n=1 Tax=Streptomyces sp. NPDC056405 TaxID=3345811 RepID=UPI0035DA2AD7